MCRSEKNKIGHQHKWLRCHEVMEPPDMWEPTRKTIRAAVMPAETALRVNMSSKLLCQRVAKRRVRKKTCVCNAGTLRIYILVCRAQKSFLCTGVQFAPDVNIPTPPHPTHPPHVLFCFWAPVQLYYVYIHVMCVLFRNAYDRQYFGSRYILCDRKAA